MVPDAVPRMEGVMANEPDSIKAAFFKAKFRAQEAQAGRLLRSCCCASGECMCMDCLKGDHNACAKHRQPERPEFGASIADRVTYLEWRMDQMEAPNAVR